MENSDNSGHRNRSGSGSSGPPVVQRQLWEINEATITENYTATRTEEGLVYYTLCTSKQDLPDRFWHREWTVAKDERERAEKLAESSGRNAQYVRGLVGGQLLSQQIANNPNMPMLTSSAKASKKARKGNKTTTG
ncbi:hypothetical protein ED733_001205 [Metarhizium rileyi]|uniref:Uncharacterized protein n=1 Tax=Metarhizium rileyi (strain RCEF 4871) TaxID=1649241 RepID=A0A5C6G7E0_METRR|nr:hypothetical protein ED733_001205 [Metarhizium rileyi]